MMNQCLFIILFFTGVPFVLSVFRKYYLIQQGKTWNDAQTYCQATHIDLAVIESNEDMVQFRNEAQKQQFSSSAWIGMYNDVNSWRWSMGNEPLGSVTMWDTGEPNNGYGMESCTVMSSSTWNDMSCATAFSFVCFDGTKTGNNRYIYVSTALSWYEAQRYCRQHYADLASARDATENSVIGGMSSGSIWLGLFRDTWKWVDKTNFSTISWMLGKPNNALNNENCGYLNNGQAGDALCSDIMPFFCYSVITGQQQIMKVKVQSDQDVNDAAVMSAILEKIKQKLTDRGMAENITVKWRKQPDGEVFHIEKEKEEL